MDDLGPNEIATDTLARLHLSLYSSLHHQYYCCLELSMLMEAAVVDGSMLVALPMMVLCWFARNLVLEAAYHHSFFTIDATHSILG